MNYLRMTIIALYASLAAAQAAPLEIIGFDHGGTIEFQGATVSNYYTLEFAPTVSGPWTNWGSLTEQSITSSVMQCSSPMFFRIKMVDEPYFPPYSQTNHQHSSYVRLDGDTMTGSLGLPADGLSIDGQGLKNTAGRLTAAGDFGVDGTLRLSGEVRMGDAEGTQLLYFFESGTSAGEYLEWNDGADRFNISDDLNVGGSLSKAGGGFKIDHPLDPENKYLWHSFVESPDMKNVYDGVVELDSAGEAEVELPEWFEALNRDFRYQLTPVAAPAPNLHVSQEVSSNRFYIAGGAPKMKVSWQVTGIRQDDYANTHRIPIEEAKATD